MAYQPKSYRKFIAGAAVAAVVIPAAAPAVFAASFTDVPAQYEEAVAFLTEKGIQGTSETTFGTYENIKRVDAAVMLVKALGLDVDAAPASGFTDVPERAVKAVNALKEAGITNGKTATTFDSQALITRGELAIWIQRGFGLEAGDDVAFTDVPSQYADAVSALVSAEVTNGTSETTFGTYNNAKRGDFAVFLNRAANATAELSVDGVSVVNASTLTVTGTGLSQLEAKDITLAGNKVKSVTAAANGKSATVVFETLVTPNVEQTVKVLDTEYKFTYKLEATGVAVTEATYDDNTAKQFVAITVNGVPTTVADLLATGYSVQFSATDKDSTTNKTTELFSNSKTGELKTSGLASEYKVQVTLTNATGVVVSPVQTIKIKNLDLAASAINDFDFVNGTGVVQNSTTLRVGETASIKDLKVVIDGKEEKIATPTKVESSNKAVASVASGTITANTPGTATVTITYGNVTKDVTVTVVNEERKVKSIKVLKSGEDEQVTSATVFKSVAKTYDVEALDQFGDAVTLAKLDVDTSDATYAYAGASKTAPVATLTAGANGKATLTIKSEKEGSATLIFKENGKTATIGTFGVTITENIGVDSKKLEIIQPKSGDVGKSTDNTLDLSDDKVVEYNLNEYNAQGVKIQSVNLSTYTPSSTDSTIADAAISGDKLTITGYKKGTATIELKDSKGINVGVVTVTVDDNGAKITNVTFKTQSTLNYGKVVNYETFLTTSDSTDPVVSGVTLSKATNNSVRITSTGLLYLDQDGNSSYALANDKPLGQIELSSVVETGSLAVASNAVTVANAPAVTKGTLIFKVKAVKSDGTPKTDIIASTSLDVDVK